MIVVSILAVIILAALVVVVFTLIKILGTILSSIDDMKKRISDRDRSIVKMHKILSNAICLLEKQSDLMTESSQMISHMYTNRMFLDVEEFGAYVVRSNQLINNLVEAEEYEKADECKKSLEKAIEEFKKNNPHVEFVEIRNYDKERDD